MNIITGVAILGPVLHQDLAKFRQNVDVNLIGVFNVTQVTAPEPWLNFMDTSNLSDSETYDRVQ